MFAILQPFLCQRLITMAIGRNQPGDALPFLDQHGFDLLGKGRYLIGQISAVGDAVVRMSLPILVGQQIIRKCPHDAIIPSACRDELINGDKFVIDMGLVLPGGPKPQGFQAGFAGIV